MEEAGQLMNELAPPDSRVQDMSSPCVQDPSESRRPSDATAERVALVVDDDAFFRVALSTILTDRLGCSEVIEAGSFDEAVERLAERPDISIALFDLAMPGISSPANLKLVRAASPQTLVVMVSASNAHQDILHTLEAGAHGYVPKSLGVEGVTAALQSVLEGTIYVPLLLSEVVLREGRPDPAPNTKRSPASINALTARQRDVLKRVMSGMSNKEIARDLKLGQGTVKIHLAGLYRTLGVKSRVAAAAVGLRMFHEREQNA
jgi:DNA-binding NarL/FixJ family response regulator